MFISSTFFTGTTVKHNAQHFRWLQIWVLKLSNWRDPCDYWKCLIGSPWHDCISQYVTASWKGRLVPGKVRKMMHTGLCYGKNSLASEVCVISACYRNQPGSEKQPAALEQVKIWLTHWRAVQNGIHYQHHRSCMSEMWQKCLCSWPLTQLAYAKPGLKKRLQPKAYDTLNAAEHCARLIMTFSFGDALSPMDLRVCPNIGSQADVSTSTVDQKLDCAKTWDFAVTGIQESSRAFEEGGANQAIWLLQIQLAGHDWRHGNEFQTDRNVQNITLFNKTSIGSRVCMGNWRTPSRSVTATLVVWNQGHIQLVTAAGACQSQTRQVYFTSFHMALLEAFSSEGVFRNQ